MGVFPVESLELVVDGKYSSSLECKDSLYLIKNI